MNINLLYSRGKKYLIIGERLNKYFLKNKSKNSITYKISFISGKLVFRYDITDLKILRIENQMIVFKNKNENIKILHIPMK